MLGDVGGWGVQRGSGGPVASMDNREKTLRDSAPGDVYRGLQGSRFESAGRGRGAAGCSETRPEGRFTVVRVVWRGIDWPGPLADSLRG